jgi:hypothetical protein
MGNGGENYNPKVITVLRVLLSLGGSMVPIVVGVEARRQARKPATESCGRECMGEIAPATNDEPRETPTVLSGRRNVGCPKCGCGHVAFRLYKQPGARR